METENEQVNDDAGFLARLKQVFTSSQPEAPEELNPFKQVPPAQASQQAAQGAQGAQQGQQVNSGDVFKQYVAKQNFLDGVEYDAAELMQDPSAAPIITQVMKGFLQQGKSLDEATEATKTFLQDFSNKLSSKSADEKAADKHRKDLDGLFGNLLISK